MQLAIISPQNHDFFSSRNKDSEDHLHHQFVDYGKNAKEWLRKCALLLPEIHRREIWRKKGFSSLYEYAAKLAGMSRSSVDESLRVLSRIADKPALKKVVEERGIQSVRPVAAIATIETAEFWAKQAREMSKNTLEVYVKEFKKQATLEYDDAEGRTKQISFSLPREKTIVMVLDPQTAVELEQLKGSGDWNELMKEFLELRKQKLEEEKPAVVKTEARHIPAKIKTFVIKKTRGNCGYPGCAKPYRILHHTQRWALEKTHDPDRLVPLCKAHERIAHHGLVANEGQLTEQWGILNEPEWWDFKSSVDRRVTAHRKPT